MENVCCKHRREIYARLLASYEETLYLFEEFQKSFDELVNDEPCCSCCKHWLRGHHIWYGGKNEKKKKAQK